MGPRETTRGVSAVIVDLVYELLDAHDDTARLVRGDIDCWEEAWFAHLEYLRSLQRVGRELLAHAEYDN
jgi:hypothetical protein